MSTTLTSDQRAAHQLLTELRTRITTQPLPYQHGAEDRALASMQEIFGYTRQTIKDNPGCEEFASRATSLLNLVIRPLTAKWHRALEEGRLHGRDGADEFRGDLQGVQAKLREFAAELHALAYGRREVDALTPPVMTGNDMEALLKPLPFGFTAHTDGLQPIAARICRDEARIVEVRRNALLRANDGASSTRQGYDAVGLALSGGGIRSATLSLGVVQVLAERGLLKEVDFMSTVSGGGYTGCFLTQQLGNGGDPSTVAGPHGPDPEPVRRVRQYARFLSAGNLKEQWSMVTATLAGLVLNLSAPILVVLLLALLASQAGDAFLMARPQIMEVAVGLSAVAMVAYGWGMRQGGRTSMTTGWVFAVLLALTLLFGACWMLLAISPLLHRLMWEPWGQGGRLGAAFALAVAATPGILRFLPLFKRPKLRRVVLKVTLLLAGLSVPLVAVLLFSVFREVAAVHFWELSWLAAGLAAVSVFLLNINLTAPHRLYRDCLARTFIQATDPGTSQVHLAAINPKGTAPYHILNASLNIPSSRHPALRDRGCDLFIFSREWTGSAAAGYHPTNRWKANGRAIDLATAMAVSGAAFSSHMGLASMPTLTALLTLLNLRLGFWIKNPNAGAGFSAPGFWCLLREALGLGMKEDATWLNLSDGGHVENTAVYELLRRRCKFIICVDGESDPSYTFHGLLTLVRHAQIDLGIRIDPKLDDLRPDATTGMSKSHAHLCRIHYPDGIGLLLYLKLSLTGNESELIRRYRAGHPEFPHEMTLDQFFTQEQFEAYRQLGVHVAEGLFSTGILNGVHPESVPVWFRQLASNLLEPLPD